MTQNKTSGYILGHGFCSLSNKVMFINESHHIHCLNIARLKSQKEVGSDVLNEENFEDTIIAIENIQGLKSMERAFIKLKNNFYSSCYTGA